MLERIEEIQGIGLFHDANGKSLKLHKASVLYADNGRGKSTLATILRSVSSADPAPILERKTIDGTLPPRVILQMRAGHKVRFDGKNWSEARPEFLVFDADFVEKNVHSGGVVTTGHRKNLLQFALGEKAVTARLAEEKATLDAKKRGDEIQRILGLLGGHHEGLLFEEFEKLPLLTDVDSQIVAMEKRIVAARSSGLLLKRTIPQAIPIPRIEFASFFETLRSSIESIQADAETKVRAHIAKLGKPNSEAWLSQGQAFVRAEECPYCAQSTSGLDLIRAYNSHFNAAYSELKTKVLSLDRWISETLKASIITDFEHRISSAASAANAWSDQIATPAIIFDAEAALTSVAAVRECLGVLVLKKQTNPTAALEVGQESEQVRGLWSGVITSMEAANRQVAEAVAAIEAFRGKLAAEDARQLATELRRLEMSKQRHSQTVVALVADLSIARSASATAEAAKGSARTALDTLMKQTLEAYQKSINSLLVKFGASFSIEALNANYRGGTPRSEYGLALRGRSVPLDGPPSFGTALSEGDKRTLAFAFFVASTLADAKLNTRKIVVDDPMCSLDLNRKQHTRTVLKEIYGKAEQIIVLAHDIYFVRDLRDELTPKDGSDTVTVFGLRHAAHGYTNFEKLDVDKECRSPYYHHHAVLSEYMANGTGDHREVAKAIRPLLEGYLHRRFPGFIPNNLMFGQVIAFINAAVAPSPVCHAQSLVDELGEINAYAGQFHHDTNPGNADTVQIIPTELLTFVRRGLTVMHKGSL